ncbi:sulfate transporter [Verticillium alfalfae VaMs.102]|uniref:Sulfate transporter n=1 Tax=Verticillium alfalfae (strain VaMs.102 / ATCC MYA-4576 / FGSC 10136) TaxID=526221 RepID=C9SGN6_VERA1|nr:sulfate transporter [Verticillium alfalfae VaMs.102]EEY18158.1 sulfate transporter [Verticillium alfalfae VaMs.102]
MATMSFFEQLQRVHRHNVTTLRQSPVAEISGALGDLGTLLPLMIALAIQEDICLDSTLVFSGLFNVATGVIFGIPLPVQPMKAIAAAAIARPNTGFEDVIYAGQWVGLAVLLMSLTGFLQRFSAVVPIPIVKGIQLGAGLSLVMAAGSKIAGSHDRTPLLDYAAFVALVATQTMPRFPYALCMFMLCVAMALASVVHSGGWAALPGLRLWEPRYVLGFYDPTRSTEAMAMALGQLPLTTLNSVIAVSALATDLLPNMPTPSVTSMGISVGLMNLTGSWFGAMPVCHGAGGLAAQYRFGARSGASVVMLGLFKLLLGLFFGRSLINLLAEYPQSLLGIMVIAAGLELVKVGYSLNHGAPDLWENSIQQSQEGPTVVRRHRDITDEERTERWTVMMMTTAGIIAFRNDAIGFVMGLVCHMAYRVAERLPRWYHARRSSLFSGAGEHTPLLR